MRVPHVAQRSRSDGSGVVAAASAGGRGPESAGAGAAALAVNIYKASSEQKRLNNLVREGSIEQVDAEISKLDTERAGIESALLRPKTMKERAEEAILGFHRVPRHDDAHRTLVLPREEHEFRVLRRDLLKFRRVAKVAERDTELRHAALAMELPQSPSEHRRS